MNVSVTFTPPGDQIGFILSKEDLICARWDVMWAASPSARDDWYAAWHCARSGEWTRLFNNPRYFGIAKQMLEAR